MNRRTMLTAAAFFACCWLGAMAWVTGYKQGFDEGSSRAWDTARASLTPSLPTMDIGSVDLTQTDTP